MAKKTFNIKGTLAAPPRSFSVEDIEAATRQIHTRQQEPAEPKKPAAPAEKAAKIKSVKTAASPAPKPEPTKQAAAKKEAARPAAPARRDPDAPPVKKVRLSVDVFPETHKRLRIRAIENDSDIMRYVEMLIERDLF